MDRNLSYEQYLQQQWVDLPLPDENLAWADMKRRLEEDDDPGIVVWWRRGCILWAAMLLLLLALGWWFLKPSSWFTSADTTPDKASKTGITKTISENDDGKKTVNKDTTVLKSGPEGGYNRAGNSENNNLSEESDSKTVTAAINKNIPETGKDKKETTGIGKQSSKAMSQKRPSASYVSTGGSRTRAAKTSNNDQNRNKEIPDSAAIHAVQNNIPIASGNFVKPALNDSSGEHEKKTDILSNSDSAVATLSKDSVSVTSTAEDSLTTNDHVKKDSTGEKEFFFSAGIALQQQIPLAGQKAVPYNSLGRKGSLADYIPSIYLRFNKKNRWFVQGEFRYGAPQYTKEILYNQKTGLDTINSIVYVSNSSFRVKKTFYHQLPVSFHYYILPNLSLGAGFVWNKFSSAIVDREVSFISSTQTDSLISKGFIKVKNDSAFSRSFFQSVIESQYKWKRFSIGARYSFGLQPYLKFTLPGAMRKEEKNSSLQLFLRYELWKSKRK